MTNSKTSDHPSLKQRAAFITDYSAWLLGCGATCIRLEKNVSRIDRAWGMRVEITIMPRHLHMSFYNADNDVLLSTVLPPKKTPVSFSMNTRLSRLSWQIADGEISFSQANAALQQAVAPARENEWVLTLMVCFANASFCALFGGDAIAMAVVWMATLAGFMLKIFLLKRHCDHRFMMFLCALTSSVLGATDGLFSLGTTAAVALGTSVLYLVPGIPFLNSFSDLIYRHYVCAFSRFTDAVVLTSCLSAGLCTGMWLMNVGMF